MFLSSNPPASSTQPPPETDTKCPDRKRTGTVRETALAMGMVALLGALTAGWVAWFHGWGQLALPVSHVRGSDWDFQLTLLEASARLWADGGVPVWNPWTAGGVPLWANPEAPVLHPMTFAAMVMHPATVARWVLILHMAVQVTGTAVLARILGARTLALPVVAVGLLTTDVLVWRLAHGHLMMAQAAWIPWVMAGVLGIRDPARAGAVGAGLVALAVHGGGHYPAWIALASTSMLLGLHTLARGLRQPPILRAATLGDAALRLLVLAGLTGLLSAPRWWTTAKALADTPRLRGPQAPLAMGDFGLWEGTLAMVGSSWDAVTAAPGLHEGLPSLGTPLFFILAGAGLARSPDKSSRLLVLASLTAVGLFVALSFGHNFPVNLYAWVHAVPPLDRFRNPERWAMAWVPLLVALAAVGVSKLPTLPRYRWTRGLVGIGLVALLGLHWTRSVEDTRAHTLIDQITEDAYLRQPLTPPVAIAEPVHTNFEGTGRNESCLHCSDALLHEAPPELPEGPFALPAPARLDTWSPTHVRFFVPIDPEANPKEPMVTEVVVPQAFHTGWTATDDRGQPLQVTEDPGGTRVRVNTPGRSVDLTFTPPGWTTALRLGALGVLLWGLAMLGVRPWLVRRLVPSKPASSP